MPAVKYVYEITKSDVEIHCVCRQPWRGHMLRCKCCEEWFHPDCLDVELTAEIQDKAEDFVIATGVTTSVRDFVKMSCRDCPGRVRICFREF